MLRSKIKLGNAGGRVGFTIFNTVFRKGLAEKEQFRKHLKGMKEQAFREKSPKAEACLVCSRIRQEASMVGRE